MTYTVHTHKEGTRWVADIPSLEGAHTFARSLAELDRNVREVIALVEDMPEGVEPSLSLQWDFAEIDPAVAAAAQAGEDRAALAAELKRIEDATRQSVAALTGLGLSQTDQALLLGISRGRVGQIAGELANS